MRAVVQRVLSADVTINGECHGKIDRGILILLGICETDTPQIAEKLASKCANLRIFEDENGKLSCSSVQLGFSALVISNFTVYGDALKGNRPNFMKSAHSETALPLYEEFVKQMKKQPLKNVECGVFGADMKVSLINDGPVTLVIDID